MHTHEHTTHLRRLAVALAALALLAAGCGGNDPVEAEAPDEPIEVTLVDYAFVGLPDSVAAGSGFNVVNDAPEELHELVAFRLPDGEERGLDELAQLSPHELEALLGAPATVLLAPPGGEQIAAVGDGTLTDPGRYAIMCFIPTGADPQEYLQAAAETEEGPPQVDGGPPHFVHGMVAELTVEG